MKWSSIPSIIMNIIGGYMYDLFGRKYTLFFLNIICGLIVCYIPWSSPKEINYILSYVLLVLFITPITNSPIINDCS